MPEKATIYGRPLGRCPCGKLVFGTHDTAQTDAVMHEMPTCKTFDDLDALAYVTWLRQTIVGPTKDDS